MTKTSQIIKHAPGDFIDADEINQNLENAGTEGGLIPYDDSSDTKDAAGAQPIGSVTNPFASIFVNKNGSLFLIDTGGPTVDEEIPFADIGVPSGFGPNPWLGDTAPSGWLLCYGQEVSKTTYQNIWNNIKAGLQEGAADGTFTVTTGTDRVNITSHGLSENDIVTFTTTGTLPGGLSAGTTYYVINPTTNDFQVSTLPSGSNVTITTTGSGTHSYHTNFTMPDVRGRAVVGKDDMGGVSADVLTDSAADTLGGTLGAETHTLTADEIPILTAAVDHAGGGSISPAISTPGSPPTSAGDVRSACVNSDSSESDHTIVQPIFVANMIMKI